MNELEHAATQTIELIWFEHDVVTELEAKVQTLAAQTNDGYQRAAAFQELDDPDDVMLGVGVYWDTYFGPDKQHFHASEEQQLALASLQVRDFSRSSLSGSLLQFAKQGISIVHSGLAVCPNGRPIGSQYLKDVIWQGRNHALHWESGNPHQPVQDSFDALGSDIDPLFGNYRNRNLGFELVNYLGWRTYESFCNDLLSLA